MNLSKVKEKLTLAGLLVALGIIYGDIGTSPLYVLKAILGVHAITPVSYTHLDVYKRQSIY